MRSGTSANHKSKIMVRNSFTLIELLVMVAIIAVLTAILLPALATGLYRIDLSLYAGGKLASDNVYDVYILNKAGRVAFLHTAAWCLPGVIVGSYRVRFSDGTQSEFPLREGTEIADWWEPRELSGVEVAWSKRHPLGGQVVGFYLFVWKNPFPDKTIASLDVVSDGSAVPVLLAVTLLPPEK
jgi:hypothetical protein